MSITTAPPRAPSRAAIRANFQRHALIPKPKAISYRELVGIDASKRATNDELQLLEWIAEHADAIQVDGATYALVYMPPKIIGQLAQVGARLADLEPDTDQEGIDEREHVDEDGDPLDKGELDDAEQDGPTPSIKGYSWGAGVTTPPTPIPAVDPISGRAGVWLPVGRRA